MMGPLEKALMNLAEDGEFSPLEVPPTLGNITRTCVILGGMLILIARFLDKHLERHGLPEVGSHYNGEELHGPD